MTTTTIVRADDALRQSILRRVSPVLRAVGVDDHEVACDVLGSVRELRVVLRGPSVCETVRDALAVRVLDAVHADGRTFGPVAVDTSFGGPDGC